MLIQSTLQQLYIANYAQKQDYVYPKLHFT